MDLEAVKRWNERCAQLGFKPSKRVLLVSIAAQRLQFVEDSRLVKTYSVSTSRRPPSNVRGSLGTPSGLHEIAEKIGGESPAGIVFKGRRSTGYHFNEFVDPDGGENLITSRILWLRGLEEGVNRGGDVDTYGRYVYVHGTNREDRIGEPQSAGCVLMRNLEIIELYEQVRTGDQVFIELA